MTAASLDSRLRGNDGCSVSFALIRFIFAARETPD
ncbi:hypothetical protein SPHINGO391_450097 [Sphingomonas aurantiaca]|uniref:Uncharacterized protein n=1 Tax=Sphingomonas aurantiaca TaxID=185949 RepID=A0A5E7ZE74_9SPHN|nr:hypothetical protein SPHINGO391_450097 [Sphingomonas aurantiaca]